MSASTIYIFYIYFPYKWQSFLRAWEYRSRRPLKAGRPAGQTRFSLIKRGLDLEMIGHRARIPDAVTVAGNQFKCIRIGWQIEKNNFILNLRICPACIIRVTGKRAGPFSQQAVFEFDHARSDIFDGSRVKLN